MDYGDIFKRVFLLTWNNKFLYLLALLAALGGSGGASFNTNSSVNVPPGGFNPAPSSPEDIDQFQRSIENFVSSFDDVMSLITGIIGVIIAIGCFLAIFQLVMWFIRFIAEAGMIQAIADLESGVKTNFRKAFSDGNNKRIQEGVLCGSVSTWPQQKISKGFLR